MDRFSFAGLAYGLERPIGGVGVDAGAPCEGPVTATRGMEARGQSGGRRDEEIVLLVDACACADARASAQCQ
jgi:hypothetical protein